jgi:hypothetical protein
VRIAYIALVVSAVVSSAASQASPTPPPGGAPSQFQLSLVREYGRAVFTHCHLDVVVLENKGSAQLSCDRTSAPAGVQPLFAREELASAETLRLAGLVAAAALYQRGGHIGTDTTPGDGEFETLKITSQPGTVVVVTSGNPTFTTDSSRKELLSQLRILEKRLSSRVR